MRDNNLTGITVATCAQLCVESQGRAERACKHTCMDGLGRERVPRYAHAPAKLSPRVGAASELCCCASLEGAAAVEAPQVRVYLWRACMHHPSNTWKHRRRKGLHSLRANIIADQDCVHLKENISHAQQKTAHAISSSYLNAIVAQPRDSGHWYRHHSTWQTRVARRDTPTTGRIAFPSARAVEPKPRRSIFVPRGMDDGSKKFKRINGFDRWNRTKPRNA